MKSLRIHAVDSSTAAYIAAMSTRPSDAEIVNINHFIRSLKDAGIWDKLDALYLFLGSVEADSKINLKSPGTYNLTKINSPVFLANNGWRSDSSGYLDTSFNVSTSGGKYSQNNASIGIAVSVDAPSATLIGISGSSLVIPRNATNNFQARVNNVLSSSTAYNGTGFHAAVRPNSSTVRLYRRNELVLTTSTISSALVNQTITILTGNNGSTLSEVTIFVNMAFFGADLSGRQMLLFNKAYTTYASFYGI